MASFEGFPRDTTRFLRELATHNNRAWFAENKARYERVIVEPALAFIEAMERPLETISKRFTALPIRSGGSLMRIYRDTRFGKDKSPYKTNIGIQFRHELGKDVHAPGFYFHVDPGACFLGAGLWRPEPPLLASIRRAIDEKPDEWLDARDAKAMKRNWTLDGDSLKGAPKGYAPDHPLVDDLKRTDFILTCDLREADITSAALVKHVIDRFRGTTPLMRFLCRAVGVPF